MAAVDDFAILAPVPAEHLEAGLEVCAREGFVAFGSKKWELFRAVDEVRKGKRFPCLLYASHEGVPAPLAFTVTCGWYIGHVESVGGAHPDKMKYRPGTTEQYATDNRGHWAVFWHVEMLRELTKEKRMPIGQIQSHPRGTWRENALPRSPELVKFPQLYSHEA